MAQILQTSAQNSHMRNLLLSLIVFSPFLTFSQLPGFGLSYVFDDQSGEGWKNSHGLKLSIGMEGLAFDTSSLALSIRFTALVSQSLYNSRIDDLEFDLSDDHDFSLGFAKTTYTKMRFGLESDFGFYDGEDAEIEPYLTGGLQLENYMANVEYELYEEDTCYCYFSEPETISETISLGFTAGLGIKINPSPSVSLDFRAIYYGGWETGSGNSSTMPMVESFDIDNQGAPTFESSNKRYNHGFNFSVGFIFHIFADDGDYETPVISDYDRRYNSSDDTESSESSESSGSSESSSGFSSSGSKGCTPTQLKPASGRGGGGE